LLGVRAGSAFDAIPSAIAHWESVSISVPVAIGISIYEPICVPRGGTLEHVAAAVASVVGDTVLVAVGSWSTPFDIDPVSNSLRDGERKSVLGGEGCGGIVGSIGCWRGLLYADVPEICIPVRVVGELQLFGHRVNVLSLVAC